MSLHFHRVALVGKYQDAASGSAPESTRQVIADIAGFLVEQGCEVALAERTAASTGLHQYPVLDVARIGTDSDLAVVVGGDGTMLGIGRQLAPHGTPLIGINQGRLGFVTDIPLGDYRRVLPTMLAGGYEEDSRSLMHGRVMRGNDCVFEALAMNDVVVNRGAVASMVELRVEVNGRFVANHRADGIIVATPTGSTAYAFSARGPIVAPTHRSLQLTPVSPHMLFDRTLVLNPDDEIRLVVCGHRPATLSVDGRNLGELAADDAIVCSGSPYAARMVTFGERDFHAILKAKFGLEDR